MRLILGCDLYSGKYCILCETQEIKIISSSKRPPKLLLCVMVSLNAVCSGKYVDVCNIGCEASHCDMPGPCVHMCNFSRWVFAIY